MAEGRENGKTPWWGVAVTYGFMNAGTRAGVVQYMDLYGSMGDLRWNSTLHKWTSARITELHILL